MYILALTKTHHVLLASQLTIVLGVVESTD
jgi:hypothetical protein